MPNITTVMEPWGSLAGDLTEHLLHFRVSSLITITKGYPVIMKNGYLEMVDGVVLEDILGVAAATVKGTTTSKKCPVYTDPDLIYANDANAVLKFADVGKIYRVIANSGQIRQTSGVANTTQQFVLVKVDPYEENDMSAGLFKIYRSAWLSTGLT